MSHTLYAFPFACSFAVRATLIQQDVPFAVVQVPRGPGRKVADDALAALNPKRKVPTLVRPDGEVLTEIVSVLVELDEAVARSPRERREVREWLCFAATELHQQVLGPAFDPHLPDGAIDDVHDRLLPPLLVHLKETLGAGPVVGETPSVADAYLTWAVMLLRNRWPEDARGDGLSTYWRFMAAQPHIQAALAAEREALAG